MRLIVTGACGFAGSSIIQRLLESGAGLEIHGIDNLIRPGSELNRAKLRGLGVRLCHGDIRSATDVGELPPAEWIIDAAANPSVLAGVDSKTSSRQVVEHNLFGTVNLLEYCKRHRAGFILLSTSRVYSIKPLASLPVEVENGAFQPVSSGRAIPGLSQDGISESFPTTPPLSLYGTTKIASEQLALEYGETFGFPVWINRCGVLAGAGQFGRPDQGIFSFWIHSWLRRKPLKYIGFDGHGYQVRDCLHPHDLVAVLLKQMMTGTDRAQVTNFSGGVRSSMSLAQLSAWCEARFGSHPVSADVNPRPFDIPWMVLDSSCAKKLWDWEPQIGIESILAEIADHAQKNPEWLELSLA